jgi:hypothetical protein
LTRSRAPGIQSSPDAPRIPAPFLEYREPIQLLWYRYKTTMRSIHDGFHAADPSER